MLRWFVKQTVRHVAREVMGQAGGKLLEATKGPTPPRPVDIAFLFALGIESTPLTQRLSGADRVRRAGLTAWVGRLAGREVAVATGGVGPRAAARAARALCEACPPQRVVIAGLAGALVPELRRGELVAAGRLVLRPGREPTPPASEMADSMPADEPSQQTGETHPPETCVDSEPEATATQQPRHSEHAEGEPIPPPPLDLLDGDSFARVGARLITLLTSPTLIREPEERAEEQRRHDAAACDMESYAAAAELRRLGVPCDVLRVISDTFEERLPPDLAVLLEQSTTAGRLGAAAGALFKQPGRVSDLWQLRGRAQECSAALALALERWLGGLERGARSEE